MEWGIKLKSNREDLFKKRFWRLIGKMIISFTIIVILKILLWPMWLLLYILYHYNIIY